MGKGRRGAPPPQGRTTPPPPSSPPPCSLCPTCRHSWVNLPGAILFTLGYSALSNRLGGQALFYTMLTPFLAFFASFATFIYPMRDVLHPNQVPTRPQGHTAAQPHRHTATQQHIYAALYATSATASRALL